MIDQASTQKLISDLRQLVDHQGAAMIALLERISVLERALAFEVKQREALELVIVAVAKLPLRLDHVEREIIEIRKLPRGVRVVAK